MAGNRGGRLPPPPLIGNPMGLPMSFGSSESRYYRGRGRGQNPTPGRQRGRSSVRRGGGGGMAPTAGRGYNGRSGVGGQNTGGGKRPRTDGHSSRPEDYYNPGMFDDPWGPLMKNITSSPSHAALGGGAAFADSTSCTGTTACISYPVPLPVSMPPVGTLPLSRGTAHEGPVPLLPPGVFGKQPPPTGGTLRWEPPGMIPPPVLGGFPAPAAQLIKGVAATPPGGEVPCDKARLTTLEDQIKVSLTSCRFTHHRSHARTHYTVLLCKVTGLLSPVEGV